MLKEFWNSSLFISKNKLTNALKMNRKLQKKIMIYAKKMDKKI